MSDQSGFLRRERFREARFREHIAPLLRSVIERKGSCSVLDMGGDPEYWRYGPMDERVRIHILNIELKEKPDHPSFEVLQGDARDMSSFADNSFDVVHSNSLIEHVGRWSDMRRAAAEIRRLAPVYYVQTPNYWFPIDPHSNLPMVHWLPRPIQCHLFSSKPRGFYKKSENLDEAMAIMEGTSMLDRLQMKTLFPDAEFITEPFMLMAKSLIAIKRSTSEAARAAAA